jgi:HSP20 family molecular chaperone IbpA
MRMYSYDQVLTDVKDVFEQLTGLPAPEIDIKKPRYPLPKGINPVTLVQSEINQLNMCLINSGISWRLSKSPAWTPPAEVCETQDAYLINLELPGLGQEDIKVTQTNSILTIRGVRRFKKASEDSAYHSSERAYGSFERLFPLPSNVQPERMKNKFVSGILQITIPKLKVEASGRSEE